MCSAQKILLKFCLCSYIVTLFATVVKCNQKLKCCFSGEITFNCTESFESGRFYWQLIEDMTTPGAVLLAERTAVARMYPNGTIEDVVGDKDTEGYVCV